MKKRRRSFEEFQGHTRCLVPDGVEWYPDEGVDIPESDLLPQECSRMWMFVVYADHLPVDFRERLCSYGIKLFVRSSLHDQDYVKPLRGLFAGQDVLVAPHYHFFVYFRQKMSWSDVNSLFSGKDLPDDYSMIQDIRCLHSVHDAWVFCEDEGCVKVLDSSFY